MAMASASALGKRRETYHEYRERMQDEADAKLLTLHLLLETLKGCKVTVEKQTDHSAVEGTIESVDVDMKCGVNRARHKSPVLSSRVLKSLAAQHRAL